MKSIPKWGWILAVVILVALWIMSVYNSLITMRTGIDNSWAQVEVQYQRRADLIPQLVSTVQGAADFEKSTLIAVTEARTQWLNAKSDPNASIGTQIQAANNFDSALSRLLVSVEAYPQLTATDTFRTLQDQLEGTENRIAVARKDFNDSVAPFNIKIQKFPSNLVANIFGFEKYPFFEATQGSEKAPQVNFDFKNQ